MRPLAELTWGIKRIDPDLTTGRNRDGAAVIRWPVQTGGWVEPAGTTPRFRIVRHGGADK